MSSGSRSAGLQVRHTAWRIIRRVEDAGAYASLLLEEREREFRDIRDRALLHEIVLGVLRNRSWLDHVIGRASSRPLTKIDPEVLDILRVGVHSILRLERVPSFAAVNTSVEITKRTNRAAAGFVNGILRKVASKGESLTPPEPSPGDVAALAVSRSHPEWYVRRLVDHLGWENAVDLLAANNRPAPATLRVRAGESVEGDLEREGVRVEPSPWVPGAMRVVEGVAHRTRAFAEGRFYVQDEASQLIVTLFGEGAGPRVLDLCAAPGGKTMQLAELLPEGGFVVAADRNETRLHRLMENASRLGHTSVAPVVADAAKPVPFPRESFDQVLLDAPCSGTGTLRRHPEIRWRLRLADLEALAATQRRLLGNAARLVRPGGTLVYSVCSMEPEEGTGVVGAFLEADSGFRLVPAGDRLPGACRRFVAPDGSMATSPVDGLDGFYAAVLERASATGKR